MRREICIRQVRKCTVSIHLQYPKMVIMSFCSSSVIFSFKVRYCGKRGIFLRFCGITYPQRPPQHCTLGYVDFHRNFNGRRFSIPRTISVFGIAISVFGLSKKAHSNGSDLVAQLGGDCSKVVDICL